MDRRRSMFDSDIEVVPLSELPEYVQENVDRFGELLDLEFEGDAPIADKVR